jgi:hypothetical protein
VCLELEVCCLSMRMALSQIDREAHEYDESVKVVNGLDAL